jgi:hypothetical protein
MFDVCGAHVTMVSSEIIANECLAIVKTPVCRRDGARESWTSTRADR